MIACWEVEVGQRAWNCGSRSAEIQNIPVGALGAAKLPLNHAATAGWKRDNIDTIEGRGRSAQVH
jgi:hypothetical protein